MMSEYSQSSFTRQRSAFSLSLSEPQYYLLVHGPTAGLRTHNAIGEPGSISSGVAPGFWYVRITPDDAAGRWVYFSGITRFSRPYIPVLLHTHPTSPSSALKSTIGLAITRWPTRSCGSEPWALLVTARYGIFLIGQAAVRQVSLEELVGERRFAILLACVVGLHNTRGGAWSDHTYGALESRCRTEVGGWVREEQREHKGIMPSSDELQLTYPISTSNLKLNYRPSNPGVVKKPNKGKDYSILSYFSIPIGAAVAERLAHSPPIKAKRVQSPVGSLPDFRMWESCRPMPLVGGFPRGSLPFTLPLHSSAVPFSPSYLLFTHSHHPRREKWRDTYSACLLELTSLKLKMSEEIWAALNSEVLRADVDD
ncbi:hypothetical protein PR048_015717 [Dryococelus australis]|uniref:Uncharacterized protein n=1 Tax=Dryococelus australis TaxID=614101 RepID=A0ABQ9HHQ5_9NEOP|nr:hypothetical protein PR048_015717 [Dryococelus australis]